VLGNISSSSNTTNPRSLGGLLLATPTHAWTMMHGKEKTSRSQLLIGT